MIRGGRGGERERERGRTLCGLSICNQVVNSLSHSSLSFVHFDSVFCSPLLIFLSLSLSPLLIFPSLSVPTPLLSFGHSWTRGTVINMWFSVMCVICGYFLCLSVSLLFLPTSLPPSPSLSPSLPPFPLSLPFLSPSLSFLPPFFLSLPFLSPSLSSLPPFPLSLPPFLSL